MDTCHKCGVTELCLLHYPIDWHTEIKKRKVASGMWIAYELSFRGKYCKFWKHSGLNLPWLVGNGVEESNSVLFYGTLLPSATEREDKLDSGLSPLKNWVRQWRDKCSGLPLSLLTYTGGGSNCLVGGRLIMCLAILSVKCRQWW